MTMLKKTILFTALVMLFAGTATAQEANETATAETEVSTDAQKAPMARRMAMRADRGERQAFAQRQGRKAKVQRNRRTATMKRKASLKRSQKGAVRGNAPRVAQMRKMEVRKHQLKRRSAKLELRNKQMKARKARRMHKAEKGAAVNDNN